MYFLYSVLLTIGIVLLLPRFLLDALRHGKYLASVRGRIGDHPQVNAHGRSVIWLHCVSVGETQAARPLVSALAERYPTDALVISTTTLTGQALARQLFHHDAATVFYFPFDWAWTVRRALRRVNPSIVLLMETELWPRFLHECRSQGVPVALVNGRISERSFRGYKRLSRLIRPVINNLTLAVMQTEQDAKRVAALGLAPHRIKVSGNIKFDVNIATARARLTDELAERFGFNDTGFLIVAASTHAPEERIVLQAFKQLRAEFGSPLPRLLIAPRHPERFAEVAALLDSSGLAWARRCGSPLPRDRVCDAVLLDTIGELQGVFPLASLVFVGGSIAPVGGHNVLEPAAAAKCIITGAHTSNFASIIKSLSEQTALVQLSAITEAEAATELARVFKELFTNTDKRRLFGEQARVVLEGNRGATKRTIELLAPLLDSLPTPAASDQPRVAGRRSSSALSA